MPKSASLGGVVRLIPEKALEFRRKLADFFFDSGALFGLAAQFNQNLTTVFDRDILLHPACTIRAD